MNTLLILYLIYLSWGTVGQGRISILEMARYLRRSKTQTRKDLFYLADEGLVDVVETHTDKGSVKLYVQLSDTGQEYLMQNFDAAIQRYHIHVYDTILAIKLKYKAGEFTPKKLTKKQREAIAAGQKEML